MRDKQHKTSNKQSYCCSFFHAIADCLSQCCQEKQPLNQHDLGDDLGYYKKELFGSPSVSPSNGNIEETPRPSNGKPNQYQCILIPEFNL